MLPAIYTYYMLAPTCSRARSQDAIFDSTEGGLPVRTNGLTSVSLTPAAAVPRVIALRDDPQPGVCSGLKQALRGMRVGGKRVASFPASLGFGDQASLPSRAVVTR